MKQWIDRPEFSRSHVYLMLVMVVATLCLPGWAQEQIAVAQPKPKDTKITTSTPPSQAQLQPEYIVGEGDVLHINVWKEPEISGDVMVRPDGNISVALIHDVPVVGLSPPQIQELITDKLKSLLTNPQVTVMVKDVRSKKVYITGEINKPGVYSVAAPLNVLQLIAQAGGLNDFAKQKDIYILRGGDKHNRLHFNYKDVIRGKHLEQNIALQPGDTVVVP
jgi:polysaccharide biosynthesis/export protein